MNFGFLTPLFLTGLAAVAIPILVHLVRREERASFAFPSLMFLERIRVREHRRRTIRHWWLLLLRCLIVALLCLAFAKPFVDWPSDMLETLTESRDRIVLRDRSYSMQYGARWDDAMAKAREAIGELDPGDRASLMLFDHDTLVSQKLTTDHASLIAMLSGLEAGHGHTDIIGAVERAGAMLEKSNAEIREIVLISDLQRTGIVSGDKAGMATSIAAGIDVIPRPISGPEEANAAVAAAKLRRKSLGTGDAVELTARIVNAGSVPVEETDLVMEVDGHVRERTVLSLAPGETRDTTFRLVLAPGELLQVRIGLGADALRADNSFHILVSGPTAISVLLLENRGAPPEHALHLLEALRQGDNPGFRVTRRIVAEVSEVELDTADVIIINDAPIPGGRSGERLEAFLQAGGGLLVVTGQRTLGSWPNEEGGIVPGQLGSLQERAGTNAARLLHINTLHPALATFAGTDSGNLSAAQVFRYRRLTGVDDDAVLARYDDESVAIAARAVGRGRVLVLTTTLDPSWNTLALQPGYLPFLHEALKYLAAHVSAATAVTVGDTVDLKSYAKGLPGYRQTAAALTRGAVTTMRTPSGKQIKMNPGDAFARVRQAGFHAVHVSGGDAKSLVFAANPEPRESDLAPLDVNAFVAKIGISDGSDARERLDGTQMVDSSPGQRTWWVLLLICALLLGLDTLFSNRLSQPVRAS